MVEEVRYASAKDYKQVCLVWGGTMLLLCLAGALRWRRVSSAQHALLEKEKKPGSLGRLILVKAKMLLQVQLPPRGLWTSICGGLSLGDLLLVCTWLALVLWYFLDKLQGKLARLDEQIQDNPALSLDFVGIKRQKAAAKSMGTSTRVQLLLLLYPVQRSSLLAWLFGTHFSSVIKYHRWLGWGLLSTVLVHGYLYSVVWLSQGNWVAKGLQDTSNAAGIAAACVACFIASTSTCCFRRWWYQAFWLVHVCSMPLFFVAVIIHDPGITYHSLPGVLLYCLDRAFRTWQHHTNVTHASVAGGGLMVRGNIITMRTLWSAEETHGLFAGQTVYLSCPAISIFGSHPFSIADVQPLPSSAGQQVLVATLHMRVTGSWTRKLKQFVLQHPNHPLQIQVEGPYNTEVSDALLSWGLHSHTCQYCCANQGGNDVCHACQHGCANTTGNSLSQHLGHLPGAPEVLAMVSGGIGITPLLGVLKLLAKQHNTTHASDHALLPPLHSPLSQPRRGVDIELGQALARKPPGDMKHSLTHASKVNDYTKLSRPDKLQAHTAADDCLKVDGPSKEKPGSTTVQVMEAARHKAPCAVPHVYLVYCCRHLEELQLLDKQLLDAASRSSSWLHLHIAYTGFELEHRSKALLADRGLVLAEPAELLHGFPSGQSPRLLYPSLGLYPLAHVSHAVLTFLGAAAAGLLLPGAVRAALASANQKQPGELIWGIMVSVLMGLGAFLSPFLLLVFLEGKRRRRHASRASGAGCCSCGLDCWGCVGDCCARWWGWLFGQHKPLHGTPNSVGLSSRSENGYVPLIQADLEHAKAERQRMGGAGMPAAAGTRVLPGYILAWGDLPSNRIPLHRGRPPLASLLRCIQDRHSSVHSTAAPTAPEVASRAGTASSIQGQHSRTSNSRPCSRDARDVEIGGHGEDTAPCEQQQQQQQQRFAGVDSREECDGSCRMSLTQGTPLFTGMQRPSWPPAAAEGGALLPFSWTQPQSYLFHSNGGRGADFLAEEVQQQGSGLYRMSATKPHRGGAQGENDAPVWEASGSSGNACDSSGSTFDSKAWAKELPRLGREGLQVWVGGPEALWQGVWAACKKPNEERSKGPLLDVVRVAHQD